MKHSKKILSPQYLLKITQVFEKNNWTIENTEEQRESLFNRYCERILELGENSKRNLVLELTERYLWIQQSEYLEHLIKALINLLDGGLDISQCEKIYVTPLIAPEDKGKVKSSIMLVYLFNDVRLRHHQRLAKIKFEILDEISNLPESFNDGNSILLLADDYIGTGETAEKYIEEFISDDIPKDKIAIISLVAQEQGIQYLQKHGIRIVTNNIRKKGISDYYFEDELHTNMELMRQIDERLSIKSKYRFGYGMSEALVTMCRTPNNTFPIFWEENGNMRVSPFPRF